LILFSPSVTPTIVPRSERFTLIVDVRTSYSVFNDSGTGEGEAGLLRQKCCIGDSAPWLSDTVVATSDKKSHFKKHL
jgi:hypothetical protein